MAIDIKHNVVTGRTITKADYDQEHNLTGTPGMTIVFDGAGDPIEMPYVEAPASEADISALTAEVDSLQVTVTNLDTEVDATTVTANAAQIDADAALVTATAAQTDADTALTAATTAQTNANAALALLDPTDTDDIVPPNGFFPPMPLGFRSYGDSNTYATTTGWTGWRTLVGDRLDVSHVNVAANGMSAMDWAKVAVTDTVTAGDVTMILPGYNDLRANGADLTKLESYRLCIAAAAAWRAIPDNRRILGSALSPVGTWEAIPAPTGYGFGIRSMTPGDTVTFEVEGTAVYLFGLSITAAGGPFTLTIDGVVHSFTSDRTVGNGGGYSTDTYAPALYRVGNLGDGKHTCVVTVGATGYTWVLGVAGSNMRAGVRCQVALGNTLRMNAVGAALGAPYNNYTDAGQLLYSKAAEQVACELAGDGLNIVYVDAAGSYDLATGTDADNIHLNQTGQNGVAAAFIAALDQRQSFATASASVLGRRQLDDLLLGYAPNVLTIETVAGTTYILDADDVWRHLRFTNAGAVTLTVPTNASIALPIGSRIRCTQAGAGVVTLAPAVGVTLNSRDAALASAGQFAVFEIEKVATDEWDCLGDLT